MTQQQVDAFLAGLAHARLDEVRLLRAAILAAAPAATERVKWNAPSFCIGGDDRVTFRLQPGDRVELVLHRGAAKRDDTATFRFAGDPTGLVRWAAPDRGVIAVADRETLEQRLDAIVGVVVRWLAATAP